MLFGTEKIGEVHYGYSGNGKRGSTSYTEYRIAHPAGKMFLTNMGGPRDMKMEPNGVSVFCVA
jgi:hypothetical protein